MEDTRSLDYSSYALGDGVYMLWPWMLSEPYDLGDDHHYGRGIGALATDQ